MKKKEIKHKKHINKQNQEAFIVVIINYRFIVFLLCWLCKIIFYINNNSNNNNINKNNSHLMYCF